MKLKLYLTLLLSLTSFFYTNLDVVTSIGYEDKAVQKDERDWVTINIDGNLSLPAEVDAGFWNYHTVGFDDGVQWTAHFGDEVVVELLTSRGDSGHLAAGMWWTEGFVEERKIPIHDIDIRADFDIVIEKFIYHPPNEWLRVALACAVQRLDGSVVYTELDILDSPNTLRHPNGNTQGGGDVIFKGGDVVEYRIDEIPLGIWRHYSLNLTGFIDRAWAIEEGDQLESVYVVIESELNPVEVELRIDNMWISMCKTPIRENTESSVQILRWKENQHGEMKEPFNEQLGLLL